jgi:hypothetical protein
LSRLVSRRLILNRPGFPIMNRSFARFVVSSVRASDLELWQVPEQPSRWSLIRVPASIVLACSALLLIYVFQDSLPGALVAMTTALPAMVKLFDVFRPGAAPGART